ncbi:MULTISPECIES: contractile injection system protein, VgrG/Pvc8 family [unclassified Acinetobacter]|uniref:contractile injection system protein, VgrG/Pvc8 family n=1 Tax=unclassified Acinetobacter TaxID=196816 RepID=UPI0019098858|nr:MULTISPECIES: contractile injection system protein, VgrG/Pvc8 family [unclassified Acinetobacter]MBK0062609.1 DNA primase [Acinetobacter sp. S55]MBK0065814.1 DNA primase [Acinetobacter sp. S54]
MLDDITTANAHAIYKVVVNGQDITAKINSRLISMTIADNRGIEADSVLMNLSDHDGLLDIPPKGAEIEVWIGWSSTGLLYKGKYFIKEREHSGTPDVLSLRATSADLKASLKRKREDSFHDKTIGEIISSIAARNGLDAIIQDKLASIKLAFIEQNESDANLMTRIADEHDAIATVKNGTLLFLAKGKAETVTGQSLPEIEITRQQGDRHRFSDTSEGDDISGVTCYYYDLKLPLKQQVTIGNSSLNVREIRHPFRDRETALHKAQSEYNHIKRKATSFSYSFSRGRPELIPEMTFKFTGLKSPIDDIVWLGTQVTHRLDGSGGFTTDVTLEVMLPDADDISQLIENERGDYTGIIAYYGSPKSPNKVTQGDQSNPKRLTYLYKTKITATKAAEREFKRLQDENSNS